MLSLLCRLLVLLGAVAVFSAAAGLEEPADSHVIVLDDKSFDSTVAEHKFLLVEFYAPWCGHCKRLHPEYTEAAATLKKSHPDIRLAKMDVTEPEHKPVASKYGVTHLPTLKLFRGDVEKMEDYKGPRTASGIVDHLDAVFNGKDIPKAEPKPAPKAKPAPAGEEPEDSKAVVLTNDNFESTIAEGKPVLIDFYAPWCGHCKKLTPVFTEAAAALHEEGVAVTMAMYDATQPGSVSRKYGVKGYPSMLLFADGDSETPVVKYSQTRSVEAIKAFMVEAAAGGIKRPEADAKEEL